ncbi:MAG TPA: SGNH/GDSL hydrolase family protein [Actinopolymorphaceae bacterium]
MDRRQFLVTVPVAAVAMSSAGTANASPAANASTAADDIDWYDVREWGVEGRGFDDTEAYFDRLPARAKDVVRPEVWSLARNSAGMSVRFEADTTAVHVRYTLTTSGLAMPHMPATGDSGLDLYGRQGSRWHWIATLQPTQQVITDDLHSQIAPGRRAYQINLPLYNGVESLEIGVPAAAAFEPIAPRTRKPILFYGTSITQGACASRPGMAFVSILGRRLDRPMLNFGFSGNGRTELEVARFLAELDPAIFVVDTIANTPADGIEERMVPMVSILAENHPDTPVLIVDERRRAELPLVPHLVEYHEQKTKALRKAFETLKDAGVDVHFRRSDDLIGRDGEGTVDGSHPNDLGMMRYADALEPDLRRLLRRR